MKIFSLLNKIGIDDVKEKECYVKDDKEVRGLPLAKLPPLEDGKRMPNSIEDFKEWHCKLLHKLDKHAEKEEFSGLITLQVDIPKFIRLAQGLNLIDWAYYEDAVSYLKNENLKQILRAHNLKVSGKKQELVNRILQNIDDLDVKNCPVYSDFYILTKKGHEIADNYYSRFEMERIDFFKRAIELIQSQNFNDAYRMICKRNAENPVPPGMGCDWEKWYYEGLTNEDESNFLYQLNNSSDKLMMAASIYDVMSGEGVQKIQFYIRHAFNVETNIISNDISLDVQYNVSKYYNQHTIDSYNNADIIEYCFLASLDGNTCPICGALDGKIFSISEMQVGVNCPPMHKGCRCTTISVIDSQLPDKRRAHNLITNKSEIIPYITYSDWIKQFR